jgi:hypothetical protein
MVPNRIPLQQINSPCGLRQYLLLTLHTAGTMTKQPEGALSGQFHLLPHVGLLS